MYKILGVLGIGAAVFTLSYHYNKRFMDWLRFQSLGTRDYIVERLAMMFIEIPPQRILIALFSFSFGLGSMVFLALLPQVLPGIFFGIIVTIIGWKSPKPVVDWLYQRRVKKFVSQMVDALSLMSNGLKSGLSVVQSMSLVTQEMANPIQQEFNLVLSENKLGVSLEEAFSNLSKRIKSDDVEMFVTSVNILKETGGNLAETFDTIVTTIRDRIKVENKIQALTAQGFYQGVIVMMVPPVLGLSFYQSDPDFMRPLFTTLYGWIIIAMILFLEALGFFVVMKIIKIDV
ncbi:MAG: type II secretion system F family protein [Bdellovibrionota bacterium]